MPKLNEQLCFEVYKAANQFTKLYAKALQPFQLTYPQYIVLLTLFDEDEQTTAALCQKLDLGIGTLNPIVTKLIAKGWLVKTPSTTDRRASVLSLTSVAYEQQPAIERAIYETMFCTDFLATNGPVLKEQLTLLNTFLSTMNKEETE